MIRYCCIPSLPLYLPIPLGIGFTGTVRWRPPTPQADEGRRCTWRCRSDAKQCSYTNLPPLWNQTEASYHPTASSNYGWLCWCWYPSALRYRWLHGRVHNGALHSVDVRRVFLFNCIIVWRGPTNLTDSMVSRWHRRTSIYSAAKETPGFWRHWYSSSGSLKRSILPSCFAKFITSLSLRLGIYQVY